ncbi:hypothetical protein C1645_825422 [Glomus cerebriforme]|uniref:MIR domain-containing protein n=1 Tax=Glomus cerebriforme TaxID=658196 RepID=A0A397T1X9_9GLOM|nr:hypothetical protein C1645_825422 [Glomus cerebriforme]
MDFPKYDGNIHPDDWINDIQKYFILKPISNINNDRLKAAILSVDFNISLPTGIDNYEKLRNALKEDISFTIFKNTNKRKLQSLKYIPENRGGDTSNFISTFRKLCYNAEINDIEVQKKYLYKSLPMNYFDSISNEFNKKMKNINSINDLIKEFEDFVIDLSNFIINDSIVALKHIATGKYLSSIENLCYTTGSCTQSVFVGSPEPGPNSLWRIKFNKELATCADTSITLQHIKSNKSLGIIYNSYYTICDYIKSPLTRHTEVSCNDINNIHGYSKWSGNWKFNHSKLQNHQGYLKSNDIINLSINKEYQNGPDVFLRSHDVQFTIGNDTFQEVVCHNERIGGNDEWCIELFKQYIWTADTII